MLNLCVSIIKARLYIWHICVEPPDAFITAYVSLLVPAGRRAAPAYVRISLVLMLACVVDTCLDAACVCDFLWVCAGSGVGVSLLSLFSLVVAKQTSINKCIYLIHMLANCTDVCRPRYVRSGKKSLR